MHATALVNAFTNWLGSTLTLTTTHFPTPSKMGVVKNTTLFSNRTTAEVAVRTVSRQYNYVPLSGSGKAT
jgi:hypothetical protein